MSRRLMAAIKLWIVDCGFLIEGTGLRVQIIKN
jgi:hypothetical protein